MINDKEVIAKIGHIYNTTFGLAVVVEPAGVYMKMKLLDKRCTGHISSANPQWGPGYATIKRDYIKIESRGLYSDTLIELIKLILLK